MLQTMKKLTPKLKSVVVLIAFTLSCNLFAANYYWIDGSGNWNDAAHWSQTSGGPSAGIVPGANDNVIFDNNSFTAPNGQVILNGHVTVHDIKFASPDPFVLSGENFWLRVTGDFLTTHKFYSYFQTLIFDGPGNHIISTAAGDIGANIQFKNGHWQLQSLLQTLRENAISFEGGSFQSNGFSVAAGFIAANTNPVNLDFSGSHVIAFNTMDLSAANNTSTTTPTFITLDNPVDPNNEGGFAGVSFDRDTVHTCLDFGGVPTGVIFTVTDVDYNGYNVTCQDSCDGEVFLSAAGTPGGYSYAWDTPIFGAQQLFSNICPGTYNARVKDSSQVLGPGIYQNCTTVEDINEPTKLFLDVLGPTVDITCFGFCDGDAFTDPGGGIGPPYSVIWATSLENTPFPSNLCEGPNLVTVTDGNGCTFDTTLTVNGPPDIDPGITITPPTCNGDCDAEILSNPSGGNGPAYSFNWSVVPASGQGTNPGIGFCSGNVLLSVFDGTGCQKDTLISVVDPPVLNVSAAVVQDALCFGSSDGQAAATPAGGVPPYTFEWFTCGDVSTGITDQNPTNLSAGCYYVVVTDAGGTGCTDTSNQITIDEPTPVTITSQVYHMSCFGVCDGASSVTPSGGTPFSAAPPADYTYSWVTVPGGAGVGAQDSLSGLCAGLYEITVTDSNGCASLPDTVEVIEPPQLTVVITETDPSCYDLCDGSFVAVPAGGTPPYSFVWSTAPGAGQGTANPTMMCAGIYTLDLTDAEGCNIAQDDTLISPPQYDVSAVQTNLQCNGDADGSIDITVNAGGDGGPYTYNWLPVPPVGQGTPSISGLTAGVWCVTISDGVACDTTICYTIAQPTVLSVNASVISQVSCFGECNGSGQVVIAGGTAAYNISWTPSGGSGLVASNLCAGAYTVTVTDANGCVDNDNINITQPGPFVLDTSHTDVACFGNCTGTATANVVSGGTGPYSWSWSDAPVFQVSPTAINLCEGNYTVTITDQNMCDTIVPFTVIEPPIITIDTNVVNSACFGSCSGEANVVVAGGTLPYFYQWFNAITGLPLAGETSDVITNLCPGDYYAQITDGAGCTMNSDTLTITELPQIFTSVVSVTPTTCGLCDGTATVNANGGTGSFTYTWNPVPGGGQGTPSATGLCGGVYNVVAMDQAGCTANIAVNINSVALEVTTMDSTNISCFGLCDGQAQITYNLIDPPYTVEWYDAISGLPIGIIDGPPASNPSLAMGLCAGTYFAVLTNQSGCVTSDTVSIVEPPQITALVTPTHVTCNGLCDGSATVVAGGGTPGVGGYTYAWNPLPGAGQGTTTANGLCAGNWDVTVTDSLGCNANFPTTVSEPILLVINNISSGDISCFGANDGTASVLHSGGTGPYTYEWFSCISGLPIGQTTQSANNLGPGDYQVVVTDANSCNVTSACVTVNEPLAISATLNIQPVGCFGFCDGLIDVVAGGGTAPYFYQWQDEFLADIAGQTNDTMNNVCQGIYHVEVTDINGCSQTFGPADMTAPINPWIVNESQTDVTCSGTCDGTATVAVLAGNNPPYTYLWDDPLVQVTPTATNLCAGIYNVTISDAGICDTVITFTIVDPNPIMANANITNVLCNGDCTGQVDVSPSGGTGPYTVTWSDLQVGDTAFTLCAGFITATITDASGCVKDTIIEITEPAPLSLTSSFSNNPTCSVCNGSATVNVNGGVPAYSYLWAPAPGGGQGTNNATGLCSGITSCTITDQNGCTLVEVFALSDVNAEVLTMDSTDASCFGVCDGGAEVIYVCGDPACTNQWFDGITGQPIAGETASIISNLCAGDYYVEVTNASGCVSVGITSVNSPTQILANEVISPITCNGAADGTITLAPSGGSGAGYTYSWTPVPPNGNGTNQALNLSAGTWCVDITDSDLCTESYCYDLTEPNTMVITPTITDPLCNGDCNGIISVSVVGGYGSYSYQWLDGGGIPIPGEVNPLIGGLCAGNYTIEVTDAGGCIASLFITLTEPSAVTSPISGTDVLCFGDCDGTTTVNPSGGFAPYTVNWYNTTSTLLIGQTGNTAINLCPEFYHAVITDNNGCNFTTPSFEVQEPPELTWTIVSNDASCFGVCDGDAEITPVGGTPIYTYTWLDGSGSPIVGGTNPVVSNLCADNYTVTLADANGCSSGPQPVVINEFPEITGNVLSNNATCGVNDGNATVFVGGGNPPYNYQWTDNLLVPIPGETNSVLLNAGSGIYFVVVTDGNGCSETFQATISDNSSTVFAWDAINHPSCFGDNDGSLEITATTVNPPLSYTWNPGGIIAEDPTGLTAGLWTLQITDAMGCVNFYDTTLVDPAELIVSSTSTPTDCGLCNGTADLTIIGGTGVPTILWNNGETVASITGLCAATYEAQVTDANGCMVTEQVEIPNNGGLPGFEVLNPITCPGACDGSILVSGIGGAPPYTYLWMHDNSNSDTQLNLCASSYFVTITDAAGCNYAMEIELTDPPSITENATVSNPTCGNSDGSITVLSAGGILPHTYLWTPGGQVTNTISNVGAGVYTLTVTDAAGCSTDFVYGLSNSNAPAATLVSTNVNCNAACDGTADTLNVVGGTAPFTYQWLDGAGSLIVGETNPLISGLCAGDYLLEITDNVGCISYTNTSISEPDTILLNPIVSIDPSCAGICDGELITNPFGGTLPFTYLWDNPLMSTGVLADSLCDGTYNVVITDANGCIANQSGVVTAPTPVTAVIDSIMDATCLNSADGEIYITAGGGTPGYTFEWISQTLTDTLNSEDPAGLLPMTYYLTVTDTNGCAFMDTLSVDTMLVVLVDAGLDTVVCFGSPAALVATSNVAGDFSWFDTTFTILSDTSSYVILSSTTPGIAYYVATISFNGCSHSDTVIITTAVPFTAEAGPDVSLFSTQTATIGGSPTSNDLTHVYAWTPLGYLNDTTISNPDIVQPQNSGLYYVIVTDTNGCTAIDSMYLEVKPEIVIPDGISPDGNGLNDTWILDFLELYPGVDVQIGVYNRWGEPIFASDENYGDDWGGTTSDGKRLPAGTYYYTIEIDHEDFPEPFTGPITIMW